MFDKKLKCVSVPRALYFFYQIVKWAPRVQNTARKRRKERGGQGDSKWSSGCGEK